MIILRLHRRGCAGSDYLISFFFCLPFSADGASACVLLALPSVVVCSAVRATSPLLWEQRNMPFVQSNDRTVAALPVARAPLRTLSGAVGGGRSHSHHASATHLALHVGRRFGASVCACDELVDGVRSTGDRVEITGIYKAVASRINPRRSQLSTVYCTYVDAVHCKKTDNSRMANEAKDRKLAKHLTVAFLSYLFICRLSFPQVRCRVGRRGQPSRHAHLQPGIAGFLDVGMLCWHKLDERRGGGANAFGILSALAAPFCIGAEPFPLSSPQPAQRPDTPPTAHMNTLSLLSSVQSNTSLSTRFFENESGFSEPAEGLAS